MTKEEQIKFNKVLISGQLKVNLPVFIVMFGLAYICYYLKESNFITETIMYFGFGISFLVGWLAWSVLIPKWRIEAFQKLDEKYHVEFQKEAIKAKLIWPSGHIFEKTEIRTPEQKDKIKNIEERIKQLME